MLEGLISTMAVTGAQSVLIAHGQAYNILYYADNLAMSKC